MISDLKRQWKIEKKKDTSNEFDLEVKNLKNR